MITPKQVFLSLYKIKKMKLPKELSETDKVHLKAIAVNFNTVWHNINLEDFIKCGIEVYGNSFDLKDFFDRKVLETYISNDKYKKWYKRINIKDSFYNSLNFVRSYMKKNDIKTLSEYCSYTENGRKVIINHHIRDNKVCRYFLIYMYHTGMLKLNNDDWSLLQHIRNNYKEISNELNILNGRKNEEAER